MATKRSGKARKSTMGTKLRPARGTDRKAATKTASGTAGKAVSKASPVAGTSRNPGGGRPQNRKAPRGKGTATTNARTAMKSPSLDEQRLQGLAGRDPNDANRPRKTPVKTSRRG